MTDNNVGMMPGPVDQNLRLLNAATKTETGNSDVVDLGENFAPAPALPVAVNLNVTALDYTTEDETYVAKLQESADNSTYVDTGLEFSITEVGTIHKIIGITERYVRLVLTLAGTTPSITLSGWVGKV